MKYRVYYDSLSDTYRPQYKKWFLWNSFFESKSSAFPKEFLTKEEAIKFIEKQAELFNEWNKRMAEVKSLRKKEIANRKYRSKSGVVYTTEI